MSGPGGFFEQFIEDYFAEAAEHLGVVRRALLSIEDTDTSDADRVRAGQQLARSLHTLKGLSGMVGLTSAERVAHAMEDGMRGADPAMLATDERLLHTLFEGVSLLERCIAERRAGHQPGAELDQAVARLRASVDVLAPVPGPAPAPPVEAPEGRGDAQVYVVEFLSSRELAARGVGVEVVRHRLESLGTVLDARPRVLDEGGITFDFRVAVVAGRTPDPAWRADGMRWTIARATPADAAAAVQSPEQTRGAMRTRDDAITHSVDALAVAGSNVVRVDLTRLDEVMRLIGELVVSRARLDELLPQAVAGAAGALQAIDDTNAQMERQLRSLRDSVTRIRLMPMGEVFDRLRFVARDLARECGKQVVVTTAGNTTEVDKAVVDRILEPLLHLVRNAVSHGIEDPDERIARGKSAEGRLSLRTSAAGDRIHIEVEDDGTGIDAGRVTARARALGILGPDEALNGSLLDVLTAPGFSTREEADMASGRGVGLDVVRSTIRHLGGELSLSSVPGASTCWTIELPLTLMIVDALLVEVGGQRMAVPQPVLREIIQVEDTSTVTHFENNDIIPYRGGALPIVSLRKLFGMEDTWGARPYLLVVGDAQPTGLIVDRLLGIREIVVHAVTDPLVAVPGIGGATELGDGHVSLILDAAALVRLARDRNAAQVGSRADSTPSGVQDSGRRERVTGATL